MRTFRNAHNEFGCGPFSSRNTTREMITTWQKSLRECTRSAKGISTRSGMYHSSFSRETSMTIPDQTGLHVAFLD